MVVVVEVVGYVEGWSEVGAWATLVKAAKMRGSGIEVGGLVVAAAAADGLAAAELDPELFDPAWEGEKNERD